MLYDIGKRILDIFGSLVGIVLFAPIMISIAIYIKVISPDGPVFADMKKRVGKCGKEFKMYKFRTMIPNAQDWLKSQPELYKQYQENSYKLDPDPRLIKGGEIIRKFSIDEMPQFLNILLGQMSLVGPRAYFRYELEEQSERYPKTKKDIETALTTKPGLTGPWQIGGRSDIGFEKRIHMDAEYAKTHSLVYDLKIIIKTPLVVIMSKGAV